MVPWHLEPIRAGIRVGLHILRLRAKRRHGSCFAVGLVVHYPTPGREAEARASGFKSIKRTLCISCQRSLCALTRTTKLNTELKKGRGLPKPKQPPKKRSL